MPDWLKETIIVIVLVATFSLIINSTDDCDGDDCKEVPVLIRGK